MLQMFLPLLFLTPVPRPVVLWPASFLRGMYGISGVAEPVTRLGWLAWVGSRILFIYERIADPCLLHPPSQFVDCKLKRLLNPLLLNLRIFALYILNRR